MKANIIKSTNRVYSKMDSLKQKTAIISNTKSPTRISINLTVQVQVQGATLQEGNAEDQNPSLKKEGGDAVDQDRRKEGDIQDPRKEIEKCSITRLVTQTTCHLHILRIKIMP